MEQGTKRMDMLNTALYASHPALTQWNEFIRRAWGHLFDAKVYLMNPVDQFPKWIKILKFTELVVTSKPLRTIL